MPGRWSRLLAWLRDRDEPRDSWMEQWPAPDDLRAKWLLAEGRLARARQEIDQLRRRLAGRDG